MTRTNWKKPSRQNLPEIVFFAITIISAATLIVPLWNYTQYYSALYNFNYTVPGITIKTSQLNTTHTAQITAQINFTFVATNPTPYAGLKVGPASCEIDFYGNDYHLVSGVVTNEWTLAKLFIVKTRAIGPNSDITIPFNTTVNLENAQSNDQTAASLEFINYLADQGLGGSVTLYLTCNLGLSSFMVDTNIPPAEGNPIPLTTTLS